MSLDELRQQLRADAESVKPPDAVRRVHAVRELNRTRRRRRLTAVVVATAAVVATLVAVPVLSDLATGPEPADKPSGPFPERIDGDTRIAQELGDPGENSVTLTFTPDDTDFLLDVECDALIPTSNTASAIREAPLVDLRVNGNSVTNACGRPQGAPRGAAIDEVGTISTREQTRTHWSELGVEPGDEVTVRMRVVSQPDLEPVTEPIAGRIGVAAYDMTGERTERSGVALTEERTVDGQTYELGGFDVASEGDRSAVVEVPELDDPAVVVHGTTGTFKALRNPITVDGREGVLTSGMSFGYVEPLPDADAHTVELANDAPQSAANVGLAYYTRVDETAGAAEVVLPKVNDNRDPLVASDVGEPGESVFHTTFTPDNATVDLGVACSVPAARSGVRLTVRVNGDKVDEGTCRGYGSLGLHDRADELGISPGRPIDIEVLADPLASSTSMSSVQLGAGLYECSADRVDVSGFLLPRERRHDGTWFELAEYRSVAVGPGSRRAVLHPTPADEPILVASAYRERGRHGWAQTWVDGRRVSYTFKRRGELRFEPVSPQPQRFVTKAIARFVDGRLLIAYYTPAD